MSKMIIALATITLGLAAAGSAFAADSPRGQLYTAQAGQMTVGHSAPSFLGSKAKAAGFVDRSNDGFTQSLRRDIGHGHGHR